MLPFEVPFGGVAVIYQHAEILAKHGFFSHIALPAKPKTDFYGSTAPVLIHGSKLPVEKNDVWVIPEGFREHWQALRGAPCTKIMFCQNQYYLPFANNPGAGFFDEFGARGVLASSKSIQRFFRDVYQLADVPIVPCAIDTAIYKPAAKKRKQIAFMPRKLREDAQMIMHCFRRRHRQYSDIPWIAIDGVARNEAAAMLSESEVFVSLSHKESFGLPPLEAMACGCLVAGYHGDGGREYMDAQNGWWADTGDWLACVDGVAAALDCLETGGASLSTRHAAMARTVGHYSTAAMESALLAYWTKEMADLQSG